MHIQIYNSIKEIDERQWDEIVGQNRLICNHRYLKAVEGSQINDCKYYYPVVYEGNKIIGHTCVYLINNELDTFARGLPKKIINIIRRVYPGFLILKSFECGTPVALGNTISFREGTNRDHILRLMSQTIERLARKKRVGVIIFRDFYDNELRELNLLKGQKYKRVNNLPNTRIRIKWSCFEEYLNSMRSHYKWKIIKRMRRCYKDDVSVSFFRDFSTYIKDLEQLWLNVYSNAKEYKRERLSAIFFKNINECLKERSAIILIKKGDRPIGFTLLLFDDTRLIPLFSGLDYSYNKKYNIYFNLLYKTVQIGIEEGMREIELGITTLIPKMDIGADVVSLNMFMKHLNPFLNRVITEIFNKMTPRYDIVQRRVFKSYCAEYKNSSNNC